MEGHEMIHKEKSEEKLKVFDFKSMLSLKRKTKYLPAIKQ